MGYVEMFGEFLRRVQTEAVNVVKNMCVEGMKNKEDQEIVDFRL